MAALTAGTASVVMNGAGRAGGILVTRLAPQGLPCAVGTAAKIGGTGAKLYFAGDGVADAAAGADRAYDAYARGRPDDEIAAELSKAGVSFLQLGYDVKDIAALARTLRKDGFKKFFASCFAAGTNVATDRGWVAIERLRVGDRVRSRPEGDVDGECGWQTVGVTLRRAAEIVDLTVAGRVLRTTAEHPFWVRGKGWTACNELRPGDHLAGAAGEWSPVDGIAPTGSWDDVYNVHVPDGRTYFVGGPDWGFAVWSHNTEPCNVPGRDEAEKTGQLPKDAGPNDPTAGSAPNMPSATIKQNLIFRGDKDYRSGPVGLALGKDADAAKIQTFADHVLRKESGILSRFTSFTTEANRVAKQIFGNGNFRFVSKADMDVLRGLEAKGIIRIHTPDSVHAAMKAGPKSVSKEANAVRQAMIKNGEILIEGSIPEGVLQPLK